MQNQVASRGQTSARFFDQPHPFRASVSQQPLAKIIITIKIKDL
jgi:hypothetical protein